MKLSVVISLLVITGFPLAKAHGDHTDYELLKRNHFISQRSLASCQNNLEARGLFKRSVDRRADLLRDMQKRKNLPESMYSYLNILRYYFLVYIEDIHIESLVVL